MRYTKLILLPGLLLVLLIGLFFRMGRLDTAHAARASSCGQWNIISSPNPSTTSNNLFGVAAISSNDVWAVGEAKKWSIIPSPSPGYALNNLYGIAAISPADIWAVGSYSNLFGGRILTFVPPSLRSLAAISSNNVWAVGDANPSSGAFFEHWDGTQWSIAPGPDSASTDLNGIASIPGTSDLWAVGFLSGTQGSQTLTEFYC